MRTTILATMIGLVAVAFVPSLASANYVCDPTYSACAGTNSGSYNNGCFSYGYDEVFVGTLVAGAAVYGSSGAYCGYFSYNDVGAGACAVVACAGADWFSYSYGGGSYCDTFVYAVIVGESLGCPAGNPPNPGWGSVLP